MPLARTRAAGSLQRVRRWSQTVAAERRCPGQEAISVTDAFAKEAPHLLPLPDQPYPLIEQAPVKAGKTPYVRFDLNDYSIPHTQVRRWLTVLADPAEVRIADGQHVIARHPRSYGNCAASALSASTSATARPAKKLSRT
jgi:hypothetical protein